MNNSSVYWKTLTLNMMFVFQTLFLATTTWDFFLTISTASARAIVFNDISTLYTALILAPWVVGIFALAILLIFFSATIETPPKSIPLNYEYIGFVVLYLVLSVLAITNPAVSPFVAMNYVVNACWALALIYYRYLIKDGMENY